MNVFVHELRSHWRSLVIWALVIIGFMYASMVKYDTFRSSGDAANEIARSMPQTLQAFFGMSGLDIVTLSGYWGICFIFVAVMTAIFGGIKGAGIIAEEANDKTLEFLYTKPISRRNVIAQKLLALLIMVIVITGAVWAAFVLPTLKYAPSETTLVHIHLFTLAAFLIMFVSASLGALFASLMPRSSSGFNLIAFVIATSYFAYALSKLSESLDWLKYISIFRWFDAAAIISDHQLSSGFIILCTIIIVFAWAGVFITYNRRELTA